MLVLLPLDKTHPDILLLWSAMIMILKGGEGVKRGGSCV